MSMNTEGATNSVPAVMPHPGAMHHPADVDRELGRLGAGQQHAVVERVQEAPLGDPAAALHKLLVHHRNLSGRTAEADEAELQPVAEGFAEGNGGRGVLAVSTVMSRRNTINGTWTGHRLMGSPCFPRC